MTTKAIKATIKLGGIELDCYQMPDGHYGFSQNQMKEQLQILPGDRTGKKYLKPLLEARPSLVEVIKLEGNNATAKVLHIDLFKEAVGVYAVLGNARCLSILTACFAEALERRADAAFGVIRTEQERNDKIEARIDHADGWRKNFTRWQKIDGCESNRDYAARVRELKSAARLPVDIGIADYTSKEVKVMTNAEVIYDAFRRKGLTHEEALRDL